MKIEIHANTDDPILTPIAFAATLINQKVFTEDELEELAEHLLIHCEHSKREVDLDERFNRFKPD